MACRAGTPRFGRAQWLAIVGPVLLGTRPLLAASVLSGNYAQLSSVSKAAAQRLQLPAVGQLPALPIEVAVDSLRKTAKKRSRVSAALPQLGSKELGSMELQMVEQSLESGAHAAGFEVLLRQKAPLAASASPGEDEEATRTFQALRVIFAWIMICMGCLVLPVAVTCVAYKYRSHKAAATVSKYTSQEDFRDYNTGVFDCWDDLPQFCFVFQCPWIVWAENISMVSNADAEPGKIPILGFWIAFVTFMVLTMMSNIGGALIWVVTVCVLAYFRQKFRKAFSMKSNTGSCLQDFLSYLCCCYCVIAQDARHVEEAKKQKHPAIVAP